MTEHSSQQGGTASSVDESYHFKSNSSKRVTLSGVPPQTRVSIGLVPNPEHEQGAKYWVYIGSTCWTGSKIGKPSKVFIRPVRLERSDLFMISFISDECLTFAYLNTFPFRRLHLLILLLNGQLLVIQMGLSMAMTSVGVLCLKKRRYNNVHKEMLCYKVEQQVVISINQN